MSTPTPSSSDPSGTYVIPSVLNHVARVPSPNDHTLSVWLNRVVITQNNAIVKTIPLGSTALPTTFSLQSSLSPILNQGNLGDCVANAFALNISTQTKNAVVPSRLYHYANCRILQGTPLSQDSGTDIGTAATAITQYGTCQESLWGYNTAKYNKFPPLSAYQGARNLKTFTTYYPAQTQAALTTALYTNKTPIVFGFLVYSSFESNTVANTGVVPVPNTSQETLLGGHCMNIIGYDNTNNWFICANSWGTSWGKSGLCYIPYTYLLNPNLAFDFCQPTFAY